MNKLSVKRRLVVILNRKNICICIHFYVCLVYVYVQLLLKNMFVAQCDFTHVSIQNRLYIRSGQITIIPKPECFGHFGGILLLFTTFWGDYSAGKVSIICPDKMPGTYKTLQKPVNKPCK